MPKVKYVGVATIRKINKSDFQAVDVDDQDQVVFAVHNGYIAEVSEAAAAHLCTHDTFVAIGDGEGQVSEDSKKAEKPITAWGGQEPDRPSRRSRSDEEEPEASGQIGAGDAPTTVGGTTDTSTPGDDTTTTAATTGTGRGRGTTTSPT